MKKLFYLLIFLFIVNFNSKAVPFVTGTEAHASFDKLWVDYDVTEDDQLGMRIHVKFTAYEMKDMDAYLAIYFLNKGKNNAALKDNNNKLVSSAGDVAIYKSIKPAYDPAVYEDLQLFMPYNELDLDPGDYNLTMDVKLIYQKGGVISALTKHDFDYTKPGSKNAGAPATSLVSAEYKDLWVDYDVTESGKKGMRIHVKFSLHQLKDNDCFLAIYFEKKNGDKLKGSSSTYRSTTGQSAVFKSLKPAYDDADYNDMQLFMPYNELNLGKGKFDLRMNASIIYKNGDLIKDLTSYEFWFSQ